MTKPIATENPVRARFTCLTVLALLGAIVASDAARAQVPGVGPGHCVSASCGGGGSLGRSGGGSRGGGGMGAAGAIGSAIGIGMAIGSAVQQQQQQQAKEKSGARKEESTRKVSHAREAKPERHKNDQADKPKEAAKQPADTKQAKVTEPSKNSNWSGCTGKVGTVWNAGNCGHPTMPTAPTSVSSPPQLHKIPYFVPIVPTRFVEALSCPLGFKRTGEAFYGGTRCEPVIVTAVNATKPPEIERPKGDKTVNYRRPGTDSDTADSKPAYPHFEIVTRPEIPVPPPLSPLQECARRITLPPNVLDTSFTIIPSNDGVCIVRFGDSGEIHVNKDSSFILATSPTLLDKARKFLGFYRRFQQSVISTVRG
jgi:hypothetical protein